MYCPCDECGQEHCAPTASCEHDCCNAHTPEEVDEFDAMDAAVDEAFDREVNA